MCEYWILLSIENSSLTFCHHDDEATIKKKFLPHSTKLHCQLQEPLGYSQLQGWGHNTPCCGLTLWHTAIINMQTEGEIMDNKTVTTLVLRISRLRKLLEMSKGLGVHMIYVWYTLNMLGYIVHLIPGKIMRVCTTILGMFVYACYLYKKKFSMLISYGIHLLCYYKLYCDNHTQCKFHGNASNSKSRVV